jgi:hypothetical protein
LAESKKRECLYVRIFLFSTYVSLKTWRWRDVFVFQTPAQPHSQLCSEARQRRDVAQGTGPSGVLIQALLEGGLHGFTKGFKSEWL